MRIVKNIVKNCFNLTGYEISRKKELIPGIYSDNKEFMEIFYQIKDYTVVSVDRLFLIYQFAKQTLLLSGEVAEVGVYKGGTAKLLANVFNETLKTIHLFDTFSGLPEIDPEKDNPQFDQSINFADTSLEAVRDYLKEFDNIKYYEGLFPGTAESVAGNQFCFVYIDVDIYRSVRACLEFFYPKMVSGGILICDDYKSENWPGVQKAVNEFFNDKGEYPIHTVPHQCVVVKQ